MSHDQNWQAFEDVIFDYVTGELSAADEAAFEDRLAVDQSLRESVARIVETRIAVRTLEAARGTPAATATVTPSPAARRHRRVSFETLAGALAASLVIGLVVVQSGYWNRPSDEPGGESGRVAARDTAEHDTMSDDLADAMVAYWSADQEDELAHIGGRRESADSLADLSDEDEGAAFVVPDWMLAAVAPPDAEFGPADDMSTGSPHDPARSPTVEN